MNNITRFVLYARKSSEREDRQVQSINDQIAYWEKKAKEEGIEIIKVYTEEKSAKTPYVRKAFQEMCEQISKWHIDGILCWKLDRISRNPIDTGAIQYMLQKWLIKRIITSDRIYYPEDSGLLFSVETGMANQYILDLSKNVKRGLWSKIDKGQFPGKAPQWYLNDQYTRTIVKDEIRFWLIKKMWELLLTGCHPPSKIAYIANKEWWYTNYKSQRAWWNPMAVSTLYAIFKNPFYAGYFKYNGKMIQGSHEPMISWDDFEKAQKLISHTKWSPIAIQTERPSVLAFPYTGTVICGTCGCMITAVKKYKTLRTTWEIKEYEYYHCTHKKDNSDFRCDQRKVIASDELWKQIEKIIESIDLDPEIFEWAKTAIKRRHSEETQGRENVYENINKTLEVEEKKKNRLLQMRLNGEFDGNYEEYERMKMEMEAKIEQFKIKRKELEKESVDWTELVERTFDFAKLASETFKNGNLEKKKEIFRAIGWNWTLKDGKLNANLQDWFLPFMKIKELHLSPLRRLEPTKKGISFERSDAFDDWFTGWWAHLGLNQGPTGYEPAALTAEL
jgi:site-specific DNA recombinase